MKKKLITCILSALFVVGGVIDTSACTAIYVGKGASDDGSTYIARSEDLEQNHNKIFKVIPSANHEKGKTYTDPYGYTMDYPSHTFRYSVIIDDPEIEGKNGIHDYPEVGFNENNVYVSATVSTSYHNDIKKIDPLKEGGIGEMSMAAVMLQEATSARHAMEILAKEVKTKGSAECNIVFASDAKETWMMEIVSGHQYAAVKLHDNEVAIIPNNMILDYVGRYSDYIVSEGLLDVATKANKAKFIDETNKKVETLLVAESYSSGFNSNGNKYRVWGAFNYISQKLVQMFHPEQEINALPNHLGFISTKDLDKKLSLRDVMNLEAIRFEGTKYDANKKENLTDRGGYKYRPIGTEAQMEIHIAQFRPNMEASLSGIQWQAFGNGEFTVYVPYFTNLITNTHNSYQEQGTQFNEKSYYWNFEKVMQLCAQDREHYGKTVRNFWRDYQNKLFERQKEIDRYMSYLPKEKRNEVATQLGLEMAEDVFQTEVEIRKQLENHIAIAPNTLFELKNIDQELPEINYLDADYTKVNQMIAKVNRLDKTLYQNFEIVEKAVNAVVTGKNITEQKEVDQMANAIEEARMKLVLKLADYGKVEEVIQNAAKLNPKDYKDFSAVDRAIKAVVWDKNITEQKEVDTMAKVIQDAISTLKQVNQSKDVNTGDTSNSSLYTSMALVAIGVVAVFIYFKNRSNKSQ